MIAADLPQLTTVNGGRESFRFHPELVEGWSSRKELARYLIRGLRPSVSKKFFMIFCMTTLTITILTRILKKFKKKLSTHGVLI